jgi:predicted neuraminidase
MIKIADGLTIDTITQPVIGVLHHAHCSGIEVFPDGELLVVYYHALKEANRKQAIYGVRKLPDTDEWSAPFLVSKDKPNKMEGNPVIWIAPDTGKLWLFYVESFGGWSVCNPRYKTSTDRGKTWSKFRRLYWTISRGMKNQPILTSKGWYLLPAYVEFRDYYAIFYLSKDQGRTWKDVGVRVGVKKEFIPPEKKWNRLVEQPTIIERKDGSIFCLMRSETSLGKMFQCESLDGGIHWTEAIPGILPNPGGGFCMKRLQSGNIGIIYNHAPVFPLNRFERNPVSIAISEDEGRTWKYRRNLCEFHLDDPEKPDDLRRTFGYATMTQGPDGSIHATWSYSHPEIRYGVRTNFTDIQYTHFTEEWAKEHEFFDESFELS